MLNQLFKNTFDFIDISEGYYNFNKRFIYPYTEIELSSRLARSLAIIEKYPLQKFIFSGHIDPFSSFPNNAYIGICRELIANPQYLINASKKCDDCGTCHFYSNGQSELSCSKW